MREPSLRGSGFYFPCDARDAGDRDPHETSLFFRDGSVVSFPVPRLVVNTDAALESASKHPSGMLEKTLAPAVHERGFDAF